LTRIKQAQRFIVFPPGGARLAYEHFGIKYNNQACSNCQDCQNFKNLTT